MVEAVVVIDAALHKHLIRIEQLQSWATSHGGYRGVARLRQAIELAEPATESPMETRLRMVLLQGALPRPQAQVSLRDESGVFLGRPDLYYPERRLVIEYDGATHRDSLASDNRRQNRLVDAGYRVLRFTASDVLGSPDSVLDLVRRAHKEGR
jgi:very-short-patch-repair endonuclease